VFAYKRVNKKMNPEDPEIRTDIPEIPVVPELILSLSYKDLIKVGMSENHIRTAGIILAFFLGLADDINQLLGWDIYGQLEDTENAMSLVGLIATLVAIPVFICISFMITLVRTV